MMARVQVLSTPGCAGCEQLKAMLRKVLADYPALEWEEIDLIDHPEVAERYRIMSVPALAIDGRLEFPSIPKEAALRAKITAIVEGR